MLVAKVHAALPLGPRNYQARSDTLAYRPDVDGLRAIAVIPVVLFHAGFPFVPGGYFGVDVFFVISGFLITAMLHAQLENGVFSLAQFYERRIRRIFPALFLVLAVSSLAAWTLLPPPDVAKFGHGLSATALFVFNLWTIATRSGYFSASAQEDPLLHTWSLSVEEQFYLLVPGMLWLYRNWSRARRVQLVACLMGLSFLLAVRLEEYSPIAAFYFSGARAWELLLGCLLAVIKPPTGGSRSLHQIAGLGGVALVAFAVLCSPERFAFASVGAVVPCMGAALVIWSGGRPNTWVARALSWRPLVFVGLVSYSLYLWHWPLIVFYKALRPFAPVPTMALATTAFLLAVLTWRFVESPFRRGRSEPAWVFWLAGAALAGCLATAATFSLSRGGDWRVSARARWLYSFDNYPTSEVVREGTCFLPPKRVDLKYWDRNRCLPQSGPKPSYLLVGDSHAAHLWAGLAQAFPEATVQQATASACAPLLQQAGGPQCQAFMDEVLGSVVKSTHPDAVVLSARWNATQFESLRQTIKTLLPHTRKVIVLGPMVEYQMALPRVLALAEDREAPFLLNQARVASGAQLDTAMARALQDSGATYISTYRTLCPETSPNCITTTRPAGVPVQFDYGHLTLEGAVLVGNRLRAADPGAWPK